MVAPDFDPEEFLDLLGEDVMCISMKSSTIEVLELQADLEYLRRLGLNGRTDIESGCPLCAMAMATWRLIF
jgi:hypothetical protein